MKQLEHRRKIKAKKPKFAKHDSHKKLKLKKRWRRPKGLQNKMRLRKRGYSRHIEIGWGSPNEVKGMHASGLWPIMVHNISDLGKVNKETDGAIISGKVGDKKRVQIIKEANKQNIKILNLDADKYVKKVEDALKAKKESKKAREERKKQTEKEAQKEAKKKEQAEKEAKEEKTEEEKKIEEKKEQDKVLTKKE